MTAMENNRLDNMEEKLDKVEEKVDQVLIALVGSELTLSKGIVAEIKEIKGRVLKLEQLKNKVIWMSMGAGIAGGFSIKTLIEWIQQSAR